MGFIRRNLYLLIFYGIFTLFFSSLNVLGSPNLKSSEEYRVKELPSQPPSTADDPRPEMFAGNIPVNENINASMFFWHIKSLYPSDAPRTIIWLNGGPGCSSEDGALMENGHYRVNSDINLVRNEGSWAEFANLLYIDSPIGTGFSYAESDKLLTELYEVADYLVKFMEQWYQIFPERLNDELYITGESFGGQYVPHFGRAVLRRNEKVDASQQWNLKGLALGNPWISSPEQYASYVPFAYERKLVPNLENVTEMLEHTRYQCLKELEGEDRDSIFIDICEQAMVDVLKATLDYDGRCFITYDIRVRSSYPSCGANWPPETAHITSYLRRKDVKEALNVDYPGSTGWVECNGQVYNKLKGLRSESSGLFLHELLRKVRVLIFEGDQDFVCNAKGVEDAIQNLDNGGIKGLQIEPGVEAPRMTWQFNGLPAGYIQESRNLSYALVYNASHMVSYNYPAQIRDVIYRFMNVKLSDVPDNYRFSTLNGNPFFPSDKPVPTKPPPRSFESIKSDSPSVIIPPAPAPATPVDDDTEQDHSPLSTTTPVSSLPNIESSNDQSSDSGNVYFLSNRLVELFFLIIIFVIVLWFVKKTRLFHRFRQSSPRNVPPVPLDDYDMLSPHVSNSHSHHSRSSFTRSERPASSSAAHPNKYSTTSNSMSSSISKLSKSVFRAIFQLRTRSLTPRSSAFRSYPPPDESELTMFRHANHDV